MPLGPVFQIRMTTTAASAADPASSREALP